MIILFFLIYWALTILIIRKLEFNSTFEKYFIYIVSFIIGPSIIFYLPLNDAQKI